MYLRETNTEYILLKILYIHLLLPAPPICCDENLQCVACFQPVLLCPSDFIVYDPQFFFICYKISLIAANSHFLSKSIFRDKGRAFCHPKVWIKGSLSGYLDNNSGTSYFELFDNELLIICTFFETTALHLVVFK